MAGARSITLAVDGLQFSALDAGDLDAAPVVCLHGFPDGPGTFRHQIGPLVEAGHRVIVPSLRGYEPGSQPRDGDYSLLALADDVIGWLDELGIDRAHVLGHDWGAVITYLVASRNPERVSTATALAIPPLARIPTAVRRVPRQLLRSWYMTFFQLPAVSDRALRASDWWLMRRLWAAWSPGYELGEAEWTELRSQFAQAGVAGAALSYYRQNATPPVMLGLSSTPATEAEVIRVPMLIMHGTDDACMDRRLFAHAVHQQDFPEGVRLMEVPDAGHFLHLERPAEITTALLDHFRG